MLTREDEIQITLMNDNSKNSGNKNVKSNRFLRADEQAQSIKNLFDLNVKRSSQNQFLKNILNILKNLAWKIKFFDLWDLSLMRLYKKIQSKSVMKGLDRRMLLGS